MNLIKHKESLSWLCLAVGCACLFLSCEKEEVENPATYDEWSSIVGDRAKTITFFQNASNIPEEWFPTLEFSDHSFDAETRITMEYKHLLKYQLPDSLVTLTSEYNYIWSFSSEDRVPKKPASVTIPYPRSLHEKLLQPYQHLFRLYRVRKGSSLSQPENYKVVPSYELDVAKNEIRFSIDTFNYAYVILFPELKRNDHVIIHAKNDLFSVYDNNTLVQHLTSEDYFSVESEFGKGFYQDRDYSYFRIVGMWGTASHLKFSFRGISTGDYSGVSGMVNFEYDTYSIFINEVSEYPEYLLQFSDFWIDIHIEEYGDIGEYVRGTIQGTLTVENYPGLVDIYMYFNVRRMR